MVLQKKFFSLNKQNLCLHLILKKHFKFGQTKHSERKVFLHKNLKPTQSTLKTQNVATVQLASFATAKTYCCFKTTDITDKKKKISRDGHMQFIVFFVAMYCDCMHKDLSFSWLTYSFIRQSGLYQRPQCCLENLFKYF